MLTVCTTSTDEDLATTGDAMLAIFGATTTSVVTTTQDIEYAGRLARRASRWAESYVGRPLTLQVYSETLPAAGDDLLMLSRYPVVAMLRLFDSSATSAATELKSTEYRVESAEAGLIGRDAGFRWTAQQMVGETCFSLGLTPSYLPGRVTRPWLAEYVAGYRVVGSTVTCMGVSSGHDAYTTQTTLPDDVVQAVAAKAAELYANPTGVLSRRVGDLAVEYASAGPGASLAGAAALLDPYRSAA